MKRLLFSVIIILFVSKANGQLLQGEWEGSFKDHGADQPIVLKFIINPDSSYSVYSYSRGKLNFTKIENSDSYSLKVDSTIICLVFYKFTPPDEIYLEETEAIQPSSASQNCFQKFYLKIQMKDSKIQLIGKWKTNSPPCYSSGKITFIKKEDTAN